MEPMTEMDFLLDQIDPMDQTMSLSDSLILVDHSTQAERVKSGHIMVKERTLQIEEDDFAYFMQAGEKMKARMQIIEVLPYQIQADQPPTGPHLPEQQDLVHPPIMLDPVTINFFESSASEWEKSLAAQDGDFDSAQASQAPFGDDDQSHLLQGQNPGYPQLNLAEGIFTSSKFTTFQTEDTESQNLNAALGGSDRLPVPQASFDGKDLSQLPQPQQQFYTEEQKALLVEHLLLKDRGLNLAHYTHQDVVATQHILAGIIATRQWPQQQASQENWNSQSHYLAQDGLNLMSQDMQPQKQILNSNGYGRQESPVAQHAQQQTPAQLQRSMMPQTQPQGPAQLHQQPSMRSPQATAHRQARPYFPQGQMNQQYSAGPPPQQPTQLSSAQPRTQSHQIPAQPVYDPESISCLTHVQGGKITHVWRLPGEAPPRPLFDFDAPLSANEFRNNKGRAPAASKREGAIIKKAARKAVKNAKVSKAKGYKSKYEPSSGSSAGKSPTESQPNQATSVEAPTGVPSPASPLTEATSESSLNGGPYPVLPFIAPTLAASQTGAKSLPSPPFEKLCFNHFQL